MFKGRIAFAKTQKFLGGLIMKLKKLIAGVACLAIAATAVSSFAVVNAADEDVKTFEGTLFRESDGYLTYQVDLLAEYPELQQAAAWGGEGVGLDIVYQIEGADACGGNVCIFVKDGDSNWKDNGNPWVNCSEWQEPAGAFTTLKKKCATEITAVSEAGLRLYNFLDEDQEEAGTEGAKITVQVKNLVYNNSGVTPDPVVDGAALSATYTEDGILSISINDDKTFDDVYGLQFKVTFTGAKYKDKVKAELPEGWTISFTDKEKVTDSVTACLDCNFEEALGKDADKVIATLAFEDLSDPTFTVSEITAVIGKDGQVKETLADVTAKKATKEDPTPVDPKPTDPKPTDTKPTDTKPATDNPKTGATGLVAIASVSAVALAATVVAKKRG